MSHKNTPRTVQTDQRVPMEFTSLGRAYLATISPQERQALMAHFKSRRCDTRWKVLETEIADACESVRLRGYCAASWQAEVVAISPPLGIRNYQDGRQDPRRLQCRLTVSRGVRTRVTWLNSHPCAG